MGEADRGKIRERCSTASSGFCAPALLGTTCRVVILPIRPVIAASNSGSAQGCHGGLGLSQWPAAAAWNTTGRLIAVSLTRRPARHLGAGRVSGGPPPTGPPAAWPSGKATGFRAGQQAGRAARSLPERGRCQSGLPPPRLRSPRRAIWLWVGSHALARGPFSWAAAEDAVRVSSAGWSQRTVRALGPGGGLDPRRSHQRRTPYQRSDPRTRGAARRS